MVCALASIPEYKFTLRFEIKGSIVGSSFRLGFISPKNEKILLAATDKDALRVFRPIFDLPNDQALIINSKLIHGRHASPNHIWVIGLSLKKKQVMYKYE